jgi:hypothetical protein
MLWCVRCIELECIDRIGASVNLKGDLYCLVDRIVTAQVVSTGLNKE